MPAGVKLRAPSYVGYGRKKLTSYCHEAYVPAQGPDPLEDEDPF